MEVAKALDSSGFQWIDGSEVASRGLHQHGKVTSSCGSNIHTHAIHAIQPGVPKGEIFLSIRSGLPFKRSLGFVP